MDVSATNESNTTITVDTSARPVLRLVIDRYDQWSDAAVAPTLPSARPVRPRHCGICVVDETDGLEAAA